MKVTFFTWDYANVSGGHNTWLCRFLPTLRQRGIDARVLCFQLSPRDEFPTARSLRRAGFSCTTLSEQEIKYTKQRVRWIFDRLAEDPPDVFVINAVYPAAYYAARWLREAGIPTVGMCHGMLSFYEGLLDQFVLTRTAYQVSALVVYPRGCSTMFFNGVLMEFWFATFPAGFQFQKPWRKNPMADCGLLRRGG